MHDVWTVLSAGSKSGEGVLDAWTFKSEQEARAKYDSLYDYSPRMMVKGVPVQYENCDVAPTVTFTGGE